jgi:hypothetical protein
MVLLRHQGSNMPLGSGDSAPVGETPQSRVVKNPTKRRSRRTSPKFLAEILDWHAP